MRQIHVNCGKFAVLNWQPKIHMRHCVAEFLGERWRIWRRVRDACISDTHQWRISDYQWRILRLSVRQHQWCTSETHISDAFDDCQWCINTYIRRQGMFSNSSVMHQWLVTDKIGPKAKWRSSVYQALWTVILRCPSQVFNRMSDILCNITTHKKYLEFGRVRKSPSEECRSPLKKHDVVGLSKIM